MGATEVGAAIFLSPPQLFRLLASTWRSISQPVILKRFDRLAQREGWLVVFDPKLGDWDAKLRHEDVELEGKTIHVFFC